MKSIIYKEPSVALVLDYENIPDVHLSPDCIDFAKYFGKLTIQNAYTKCWEKSKEDGFILKKLGFSLIDVILEGKNAVDYQCMFDCRDAAKDQPSLGTFILVTGDGDYACVIRLLKSWDKKVIVLSRQGSASKKLQKTASEFYYVDELPEILLKLTEKIK